MDLKLTYQYSLGQKIYELINIRKYEGLSEHLKEIPVKLNQFDDQ